MFWNCGVGEDSSESLGQQGDQINLESTVECTAKIIAAKQKS